MLKVATKLGRVFGGLKARYKLMVLHNLFFLVLSGFIYAALMPVVEQWATTAKQRERHFATGSAAAGTIDESFYESVVRRTRINIFLALATSYWLGVLILEGLVMRSYIYAPLKALLDADDASRRGDTARELIDESLILGDELGRLMSSRNATLQKLRQHEHELKQALARIEETAADLRQKNHLLATAKQNIADQDRLASIGLLTAAVAHELNTPLAVLQGSLEQLLETVPDPGSQRRLERMQRVTQRLQTISASMLDYSRVRKQESEAVAIRPLIDEAWHLVSIDSKADRTSFRNTVKDTDCAVGNAERLNQLFLNLLRNALQAIPEGGHIAVTSEARGDELAIRIEDDGPGIPDDLLADVFEAFITTRLDSRGTGLGLTVAEGIAHQHGGSITAANRPEGGARLEVRLPAAGDHGEQEVQT
jgi:signal transduction histidine kinase